MNGKAFEDALAASLISFPTIELKREQKTCLEILAVQQKDVLAILPTGFGKSLIYQLLPKVISSYFLEELDSSSDCKGKEILFRSAEIWLSNSWRKQLTSGSLSDVEFLVVDEVHTVETW